jgi:NAD(P)-dependent dehydrogenase (short-subunit alcohol dehydrogenase family)
MGKWNYQGKRVVVSGCFSGMGEAAARELVALGAEVHGLDYKDSTLNLASFTRIDLRDAGSIDAAAQKIGGRIDALFNCAGVPHTFDRLDVMKVNIFGTKRLTEKLLPYMGAGSAISSISSLAGLGWSRHMPLHQELLGIDGFDQGVAWTEANWGRIPDAYGISKEAVIVWTMLSAVPLIQKGIRINCIMPGPTQTPMMNEFETAFSKDVLEASTFPINRRSKAVEQATPLIFLNSDEASYVNGAALPVDGGYLAATVTGQFNMAEVLAKKKQSA